MLAPAQLRPRYFAMRVGYLADHARAFRLKTLSDHPLFPQGQLVEGRAPVTRDANPVDRKRLEKWNRDLAQRLGLALESREGRYGWRRCFADLFDLCETNPRLEDLVTGRYDPRAPTQNSTRARVYLSPRALPFVRTGEGPAPAAVGEGLTAARADAI